MKIRFAKLSVNICLAFLVSGCCNLPSKEPPPRVVANSADIADVFVTVLPPMVFSDLQGSLAIQHGLSAADCRTLAAQTTRSDVYQLLSQVAFGIGVSLPLHTASNTATTTNGVTSSTNTTTTGSATVPSSSGAASNAVTPSSLSPDIAKSAPSFGLDGEASIMGGTALCQAAVLAEQQISTAKLPDGYDANVITFQVNVQPKARDLSYDTYIDLELWPRDISSSVAVTQSGWGMPPVLVYPLIINDVLESTSTARSAEIIRQFSASLSGVLGNLAGVNIGGSNAQGQMSTVLGADRNSILTMGRVTANTIKIRLGAPSSGSTRYAMVPRTFNVSTLVLTRKAEPEVAQLMSISNSNFVHTDPQAPLPIDINQDIRLDMAKKVADVLSRYKEMKLSEKNGCGGENIGADIKPQIEEKNMVPLLNLLRQVDRQDFGYLRTCIVPTKQVEKPAVCDEVCKKEEQTRQLLEDITRIRLYSEISHGKASSRWSTNIISIPSEKLLELPNPASQLVVVEDDGKVTSATLRGGKNLIAKRLTAYAVVDPSSCGSQNQSKDECRLPVSNLSVSADGTTVALSLPSLSKLKLTSTLLVLADISKQNEPITKCTNDGKIACFSRLLRSPDKSSNDPKGVTVDLTAATQVVVSDINGNGSIGLTVNMDDLVVADKKAKGSDRLLPIYLDVKGAKVTNAKSPVFSSGTKGITITQSGISEVSLGNLTSGQLVTVRVLDKSGKKPISSDLTFYVERAMHN